MGEIHNEDTHNERSSSMTFALRWKHEKMRMVLISLIFLCAVTFMFFMLWYGTSIKSVSLVQDGEETTIKTRVATLQHLLDEQQIEIGEYDEISTDPEAKLKHGDRIEIEFAKPVQLTADGETNILYTTAKTVAEALTRWNISLSEEDKISPALQTGIADYTPVTIVRVTKEIDQQEVALSYETVTRKDAELLEGKQQVVQEGQEGLKVIRKERVYEDGTLIAETVVGEEVQKESIDKVVAVGTKKPVVVLDNSASTESSGGTLTKDGIPFNYKKVINNVTLTAYSAGKESTGKSKGDPGYGVTATGTTATEGRTIAVDKKVIPLGWWVYIDGIGYRRAEDVGGAVKGNKIDVFFESSEYLKQFGVKRGYTVYVIGPKKPTAE